MRKPDGGVRMLVEYNQHLRSGHNGHKRGSMARDYWREWRAKAKQALRKEIAKLDNE